MLSFSSFLFYVSVLLRHDYLQDHNANLPSMSAFKLPKYPRKRDFFHVSGLCFVHSMLNRHQLGTV
jgi:hypothetical protein